MKQADFPQLADPFVMAPQARKFLGDINATTLNDWITAGILPPPLRVTKRSIGWRLSTLTAVLDRAATGSAK